jgi:ATP-dependent RNA helicase DOB1
MRRLEELLRQMCCAAKAIGNSELEAKFTEGINKRFYLNKTKK